MAKSTLTPEEELQQQVESLEDNLDTAEKTISFYEKGIEAIKSEYEHEVLFCDIAIDKEKTFAELGATEAEKIVAVESAKKQLYQKFITELNKLNPPD